MNSEDGECCTDGKPAECESQRQEYAISGHFGLVHYTFCIFQVCPNEVVLIL